MIKYGILFVFLSLWVTYRTSLVFENKVLGEQNEVLGASKEDRFFLPFPKDYEVVTQTKEPRFQNIIIKSNKPASELVAFYKEILRSKNFQNDYEYEKDNLREIRYLNEKEDVKITFTSENEITLIEFDYHN